MNPTLLIRVFCVMLCSTRAVNGLLKGMTSVSYIGLLLFLIYYVFGIVGIMLFRTNDPIHFGSIHGVMVTLFRCSTVRPPRLLPRPLLHCLLYPLLPATPRISRVPFCVGVYMHH